MGLRAELQIVTPDLTLHFDQVHRCAYTSRVGGLFELIVEVPASGSNPPAGKSVPTADQIAKSLSILPEETLGALDTVVVTNSESGHPADHSKGTIYQYPVQGKVNQPTTDQANQDWRMLHEGAHAYDHKHMPAEREAEWRAAMDSDARHPTEYAQTGGKTEDYAESVVMYALVRGTPCEAYARKMYPARFAVLDKWHGDRYR